MASTRNKNTPVNYALEKAQYAKSREYVSYENSAYGYAYDTKLAGNGLNPAQVPWDKLSNNAPDIESFLFGIGSTNLENPKAPLQPEFRTLESAHLFASPIMYVPDAFVVDTTQRPFHP